jgi:hypothetical protein
MTRAEENAMFHDHISRDFDLATDPLLQRAVLAGHARRNGRQFIYVHAGATS